LRRWWRRLGKLDRLAMSDLVLELALKGNEFGFQLVFLGLRVVQ
jgi:hypothetical protein